MFSNKISPEPCLYVSRFTAHCIDDRVGVPQYFQTDSVQPSQCCTITGLSNISFQLKP